MFTHSQKAIDLLIAFWHDHKADDREDHPETPTGPQCPVCKPLHFLLGWSWEEYKRWMGQSIQPERKERTIGTRGIVGVIVDGVAKVTYNHFDSYPDGLGLSTLVPLRLRAEGGGEWWELVDKARDMRVIEEGGPGPTAEDKAALAEYLDDRVSSGSSDDWYCLTRKMQGHLLPMLATGYMLDAGDFPLDSLFCEWGYVVDLDRGMFQVYKGFQGAPHTDGFWGGRVPLVKNTGDYYPIRLIKEWPLNELPTEEQFLSAFQAADDE